MIKSKFYIQSVKILIVIGCITIVQTSCIFKTKEQKAEQITISSRENNNTDSVFSSVQGNIAFSQIATEPKNVILTGMAVHRLIPVYMVANDEKQSNSSFYRWSNYNGTENIITEHFMPGLDIIYGFNLLNIAHYDMKAEKLNYIFNKPVLIKTLYFPSFVPDSIDKKPVIRNYYLVSVYDEDTNKDSLINRKDLRRFYYFDANANTKIQLIPSEYSVIRSQYDSQNDVMYVYTCDDTNKNGMGDNNEPIHIFWIDLKSPTIAKKMY
jgi:hypothetical protein